jgi:hypothetical protein
MLIGTSACSSNSPTTSSSQPPATVSTEGTPGNTLTGQAWSSTTPVTPQLIPTGNPTKAPAGGEIKPAQVNGRDATAVAVAVVAVTNRHDTAIDHSPSDAQRRARAWLAPTLAAQLDNGPAAAPGAEWNTWAKHRAYTRSSAVDATESGAPPDTETQADRTIAVTVQPIGRDRWKGTSRRYAVFVTLTRARASSPWKVSQLQVQE